MNRPRRFPNTAHWRRAVDCAQRIHGSRGFAWRRGLARHLGIETRDLRAQIDRPMDAIEQRDLDDKLASYLRHHGDIAYARCLRLDAHLCSLVEARNARESKRIRAIDFASGDFEWSDIIIGTDIEEPMRQQFPELFQKEVP